MKVKSRLLAQQNKIQTFEEKKQRMENKRFHKAIKAYKQGERHTEKRETVASINKLKKQIKDRGGDLDNKDFDKFFQGEKGQTGGSNNGQTQKRTKVIDTVRKQEQFKKKGISKEGQP